MTSFFKVAEDSWFDNSDTTANRRSAQSHLSSKQDNSITANNMGSLGETKPAKVEHFNGWPNDMGLYVEDDVRTPVSLAVTGHIPPYAAGTLYRNGPGKHKIPTDTAKGEFSLSHWFDGFAQVHRFELIPSPSSPAGMEVTYNSRFNVDKLIEEIRRTGRYDQLTFGQKRDPCDGLFKKFKTLFSIPKGQDAETNNVGVTIAPDVPGHAPPADKITGKHPRHKTLTSFTDSTGFKHLDPETLEPLGAASQKSLHPSLTGPFSAAHANFDPVTGDVINHNLDFTVPMPTYRVWKISRETGKTDILATIKDKDAACAYIHASFITENFFVLGIWSSHMRSGGMAVLWERNILEAIAPFNKDRKVKWLVVDRKHGRGLVAKFESDAMFSFHNSNSWEVKNEDGTVDIVCDLVEYANLDIIHKFYYENFISSSAKAPIFDSNHAEGIVSHFKRYKLASVPASGAPSMPLKLGKAEVLKTYSSPLVGEFPIINSAYHTKPNRYLYTAINHGKSTFFDALCKLDIETGETKYYEVEHHTPGEPIFVRDPNGTEEDDGVLLVVMLDGDKGTSYLLCLDAKTMQEKGRAEVERVVPFGFHGRHVAVTGESSGPAAEGH